MARGSPGPAAVDAAGSPDPVVAPDAPKSAFASDVPDPPVSSPVRNRPSPRGVGWSKSRVTGSRSPVAARSRLQTSIAVSESRPSSLNGRSESTSSGPW